MGLCNSTKNTDSNKKALIKQISSNGSMLSLQTQLPITYVSEHSIKEGECLGRGSYGIIREAIDNQTKSKYSVKSVYRNQFEDDKIQFLKQEIQISLLVNHENIIKCYEVYEDVHCVHFVFEYINGSDLFDFIIQTENMRISEDQSAQIFSQILDALHYLHLNNIVHRDIKLENFLIYNHDSNLKVKLIDFGFASKTIDFLKDKIGSISYLAPEIFTEERYNNKVDIWAAGITLYNMLTGKQPFSNNYNDNQLIEDIIGKDINFIDQSCINLSNECKELITLLLTRNYNIRINAFQARNHVWFSKMGVNDNSPTFRVDFNPHPEKIQEILETICRRGNIKNQIISTLMYFPTIDIDTICENLKIKTADFKQDCLSKNIVALKDIVNTIISVSNDDVLISKLSSLTSSKNKILEKIKVNYTDFFNMLKKRKDIIQKEKLWILFSNAINKDVKGYITIRQIEDIFLKNNRKFEEDKFNETLKLNLIVEKNRYTFEEFALIWECVEKLKD